MDQVTRNIRTQTSYRGCNPSYVITSGGVVIIDTPQLPTKAVAMRREAESCGPIRYVINTEHHVDHIFGNYYFKGAGRSTVEKKVYEWQAGDLMLSAPGWGVHNHASYDDYVYELTVQDQPLNIAMESLLWQESLKLPLAVLGVEEGLGTNRAAG